MNDQAQTHTEKAINGISLASFLQILEQERKSCTLTISEESRTGYLYFLDGNLIDAEYDQQVGLEAAYAILSWDDVSFQLSVLAKRPQRISGHLAHIILTASTRKDERQTTTPPQEQNRVKQPPLPQHNRALPRLLKRLPQFQALANIFSSIPTARSSPNQAPIKRSAISSPTVPSAACNSVRRLMPPDCITYASTWPTAPYSSSSRTELEPSDSNCIP